MVCHSCLCFQHVLLLCGMDVDSLCACKILQAMFKADDVEHTVIPVSGWQDVKTAYNDHAYLVSGHALARYCIAKHAKG